MSLSEKSSNDELIKKKIAEGMLPLNAIIAVLEEATKKDSKNS